MKLLADECVYARTVRLLRDHGHDVVKAGDALRPGAADEEVASRAGALGRTLVTRDVDFARRPDLARLATAGLVVIRGRPRDIDRIEANLLRALDMLGQVGAARRLVIVDAGKFRVRAVT